MNQDFSIKKKEGKVGKYIIGNNSKDTLSSVTEQETPSIIRASRKLMLNITFWLKDTFVLPNFIF